MSITPTLRRLALCALLPILTAGAQELQEQPTPFSTWLDFQSLGSAHAPRQSLPIWLESVQRTAQPSNTNSPVKTTFRIRLRRLGQLNDHLQLRLFFDDVPGASPLVSGWSETGEQQFRSQPLGFGLDLATSESLAIAADHLDYLDVSVPGDGSNVRGAFVATLKKSETLHAIDFATPAEVSDPFANLPATQPATNDSFLYGRVKAVIEAGPITLAAPDFREKAWEIELDAMEAEHHKPVDVLTKTADAMPGFGIVAAVLGIVITMGSIAGPIEEIGHHVAAALVGTFLGILISYGFLNPLAVNMGFVGLAEMAYARCISAAVISFASGMAPIMAVEVARRGLSNDVKPSANELEAILKSITAPAKG